MSPLTLLTSAVAAWQVGADSVVRSLAIKGLDIAGVQLGAHAHSPSSSGNSSTTAARSSHLMGTPAEPYANPRHPDDSPDDSPNIMAGNPLEEYANPSPQWQQAAGQAAAALEEAERVLPATVSPSSSSRSNSSSSLRRQPTAANSSGAALTTAAAAVGGVTTGLGPSQRVQPLLKRLHQFMAEHVYPAGKL